MPETRVDEDAAFGCVFCKDGIVVFESQHIFPDIACDVSGFDMTSRTEPELAGGGVLLEPHPKPNWIGRWSNPMIRTERNQFNATKNTAICATCLAENAAAKKLIELGFLPVTTKLTHR